MANDRTDEDETADPTEDAPVAVAEAPKDNSEELSDALATWAENDYQAERVRQEYWREQKRLKEIKPEVLLRPLKKARHAADQRASQSWQKAIDAATPQQRKDLDAKLRLYLHARAELKSAALTDRPTKALQKTWEKARQAILEAISE